MFKFEPVQHGVIDAKRQVGNRVIMLRARQVRLDRDGTVKALVALIVDTTAIHSDVVNVDKDSERHSFANSLYGTKYTPGKFGPEITAALSQQDFEQEMMVWSRALWPAFIGASSGGYEYGDAEPSAPRWAIPGLVLEGLSSIWFGRAKANKSTLMRLAAQSLQYGVSDIIPVREQADCIWVNAEEDPREHTRQLGNANQALGIDRTAPIYTIHARGMGIEDLSQRLEKAVRETGAKHIFIDSLSRMAKGLSLNDNQTATLLMDSVGGLGPSVNWIGHTGQDNEHRLAGSKHFENAARLMVRIQSRTRTYGMSPELFRGVRANVTRANGAAPSDPMFWEFDYHRDYGLKEARHAAEQDWPALHCTFMAGEAKKVECRRLTWEGVMPSGDIRCSRHQYEDDEV